MALMTDDEKRQALYSFMYHENMPPTAASKPQLRAAIEAIDLFMDSQIANIRNQIDAETRALLTAREQRVLIKSIMQARYG